MFRFLNIVWSSLKIALQEFRSNKLRTFLSLLGITFGIFCIISVLATISSMELAVKNEIKSIAAHTIFIGKWENGGGPDYPWWKYIKRPDVKFTEMKLVQLKSPDSINIAYFMNINDKVEFGNDVITGVNYYGLSEKFFEIQSVKVQVGRYLRQDDYDHGSNFIIMGYEIAASLFSKAEKAVGQEVKLKNGKVAIIVGLINKQGQSLFNAWDYDHSILMPNKFLAQIVREENSGPIIMVKGEENVSIDALKDELKGAMRSIRKLRPTQEDNFSLTDIDSATKGFDTVITGMDIGGWAIAGLSLIVGMFGVANIMFVTVRERTSQIGLKKAIGAKRGTILTEFLLESAFLCIIGGLIGLIAVFILTMILSSIIPFRVFIPLNIIFLAVGICIVVGVLAGIIPAITAARMDPVVAIRS
ncbi:MAG TPA: ABC transporter permease [Puia sp.]|jgi:putative ABC transport system permease protein|nr:ABC transporter permease [Puia sp.]